MDGNSNGTGRTSAGRDAAQRIIKKTECQSGTTAFGIWDPV